MLPKIDVPLYEITLPLLKKKVKFRPFLVKEEKILLMAAESDDQDAILLAVKQIINNCCVSDIDIDDLPILDFEYFFMHLRARSVGEIVDLQYKCNNTISGEGEEEKKCNALVKLSFNALEIEPVINSADNRIQLTSNLGIVLKYPNFKNIEEITKIRDLSSTDLISKTIISSIDFIYDNESMYYAKDTPEEELVDFIDSLTREQFGKIQEFFESIPKLKKEIKFKCQKCAYEEELMLEGIQSFFG
jgi:hypothetical protein